HRGEQLLRRLGRHDPVASRRVLRQLPLDGRVHHHPAVADGGDETGEVDGGDVDRPLADGELSPLLGAGLRAEPDPRGGRAHPPAPGVRTGAPEIELETGGRLARRVRLDSEAAVGVLKGLFAQAFPQLARHAYRGGIAGVEDRKSTRLNSSHVKNSYA